MDAFDKILIFMTPRCYGGAISGQRVKMYQFLTNQVSTTGIQQTNEIHTYIEQGYHYKIVKIINRRPGCLCYRGAIKAKFASI